MDWLRLFSPDEDPGADRARPLPKPSDAASRAERVNELARRWRAGEQLHTTGDWNARNGMDLAMVHDAIGWQGSDRRLNGTDEAPELVVRHPIDGSTEEEYADDTGDLPDGWLEEELAASRKFWAARSAGRRKEAA